MANEKKSIIEEALLEAQEIDATFKSNAKEILSQTMSSEIEEMVKESLTGSKKRLKEDEEEEEELDLDLDTEEEGEEEEELDLDLDTEEEGEDETEETEMDLDLGGEEEETEIEDLDLDFETEEGEEEGEMDLDLGDETEEVMGDVETVDLTQEPLSDVISVFKKMGPEDEIEVVNDNGIVTLKDNKSGSEYRIEMNPAGEVASVEAGEIELGEGEEGSDNVIYEIVVDDGEEEMEDEMSYMDYAEDEMSYMGDKMSYMNYKKSGLKNPEKADLDKDHDITPYEKKRGMAIEKSMEDEGEDHMDYMKHDDEDHMDYMSRTLGAGRRFGRNGLDKPKAAPRHLYVGESKTPQISKLIKENTNLNTRNSELEVENKELKENYEKMVDALKQFRTKLQEVAVFNSNLTYAVRLFTENTTTKEEKNDILKRLDSAKSLKESQSIYKQLVKEISNSKAPIKETIEEKINNTSSSGALISEQSVFVHPEIEKMKKLWGYSYKK
jgi:hypothetical protein